jgi:hypothetical protein
LFTFGQVNVVIFITAISIILLFKVAQREMFTIILYSTLVANIFATYIPNMDSADERSFLCAPYSAMGTASNTRNFETCDVTLCPGSALKLSLCSFGGTHAGDTFISLVNPRGNIVASNDDFCGSGSEIDYTVPISAEPCGVYKIREGCHENVPCTGTVSVLMITKQPTVMPTKSPTVRPSVNFDTFEYKFGMIGTDQLFVVPSNVHFLNVTLFGAAGGSYDDQGGVGGYTSCTLPVIPGETLTVVVGEGGNAISQPAYGGGGAGGKMTDRNGGRDGGSGGGRSAIQRNYADIVVAGGGGGAGGKHYHFHDEANPGNGGSAGYPEGQSKVGGWDSHGGGGAGKSYYYANGGDWSDSSNGFLQSGGSGATGSSGFHGVGGGGGGGYYGGGGGGQNRGGGGGSNYGYQSCVSGTFDSGTITNFGIGYGIPDLPNQPAVSPSSHGCVMISALSSKFSVSMAPTTSSKKRSLLPTRAPTTWPLLTKAPSNTDTGIAIDTLHPTLSPSLFPSIYKQVSATKHAHGLASTDSPIWRFVIIGNIFCLFALAAYMNRKAILSLIQRLPSEDFQPLQFEDDDHSGPIDVITADEGGISMVDKN